VDNLPKVVTQRCLEQDLNPRPTDRKPKCLTRCTTAPPLGTIYQSKITYYNISHSFSFGLYNSLHHLCGRWPQSFSAEAIVSLPVCNINATGGFVNQITNLHIYIAS